MDPEFDAIVVSSETLPGALTINEVWTVDLGTTSLSGPVDLPCMLQRTRCFIPVPTCACCRCEQSRGLRRW